MQTSIDLLRLDDLLTEKQRHLRVQMRDWLQANVLPIINDYWDKAAFPHEAARSLRTLPIIGGVIKEYGCAGLDFTELGLVVSELARADGSITTFFSVHSGLVMGSIAAFGSEAQKERWLPQMVQLEKIGAFGLTEPEQGSDAAHVQTRARREGDEYILNGAKRWIGNAAIADILLIWGRDEDGKFGGFVIENPQKVAGLRIENLDGKIAKRAVLNAQITLQDVRIPADQRLEKVVSFRDASRILTRGRYVVAWEALGAASAAFDYALEYAKTRVQFGKPIASFQLTQQKLVMMANELTLMQMVCMRLAALMETDQATDAMIAMAKYNNAAKAREITRMAREIMGGNGLLIENHVARLWTDAEAMYTYEGTHEVVTLIIGRELTGLSAFI
jgi:glutaryl-CoA dehydrogenase